MKFEIFADARDPAWVKLPEGDWTLLVCHDGLLEFRTGAPKGMSLIANIRIEVPTTYADGLGVVEECFEKRTFTRSTNHSMKGGVLYVMREQRS